MIHLQPEEKILKIIHKHWFTLIPSGIMLFVLLIAPTFAIATLQSASLPIDIDQEMLAPFINFFLSLYIMALFLATFVIWVDYFLDIWIITDIHIIDIEQHGLFNREVSEIPLERVQDVTIDMRGIIQTMLHFGTIRIQTAGEREFSIKNIPHLQEVKGLILGQSKSKVVTENVKYFSKK